MKKRILNERLASIVAGMRHGEMLFIADAGSGTSEKALYPLSPDVEYLDNVSLTREQIPIFAAERIILNEDK